MSVILRTLLRDPLVTRPITRALRRIDDDFFHDDFWPIKRVRRDPAWDSPVTLMEDMSRQMNAALSRMQEFTEDLDALDSLTGRYNDSKEGRSRGYRQRGRREEAVVKRTESGGLQLALDVSEFKPEDLKIRLVEDNLLVEGRSEVSGKDSYRESHFKRWFKLPENCNVDEIKSKLTGDNRLVIDLPASKPIEQQGRPIPIETEGRTGEKTSEPVSDNRADNADHDKQAEAMAA